jgi:hypothetical protein
MTRKSAGKQAGVRNLLWVFLVVQLAVMSSGSPAVAETGNGEIEGRAAPVFRRVCLGGANAGELCNEDGDCPGSSCKDRNVFNVTVAVQFDATDAEIDVIEDGITAMSEVIFDVTDGQAEIGQATIFNNAFSTDADIRIYPTATPTWWRADTGNWKTGGSIHVSYDNVSARVAAGTAGATFAHEFVHLVFDARDEYESPQPGCVAPYVDADCPDAATQAIGEHTCLMDHEGTELCWGHGNPADLNDVSGGNHDAMGVTEQSRCRSGRSCWEQVVWSWPNTILAPVGAPDPAAHGGVVSATEFVEVEDTVRVVLVLDESGSMGSETPTRMERLKVAASDFITLAEDGTEVGIVSYSTTADPASGHADVDVDVLGADRSDWMDAIDALSPSGRTNIGDGLDRARDMIMDAGGVTASTFIILMSDGINNEPWPDAADDLEDKLDMLLDDGIAVYVTCTGGDLGLDSQCSEIATGTNGFYVDSADAAQLPEAFVDFHEKAQSRGSVGSKMGYLSKGGEKVIYVEDGAESVTFVLVWHEAKAGGDMTIIDPYGNARDSLRMPQGRYARFKNPTPGNWKMVIRKTTTLDSAFVARGYVKNQLAQFRAAPRYSSVLPGQEMYIYAYPRYAGPISSKEQKIVGTVIRPDGKRDRIILHDGGRVIGYGGDDVADDGIFTGVYRATRKKGAYTFLLHQNMADWKESGDTLKRTKRRIPRFMREVRVSAAVGNPLDIRTGDTPKGEPEPGGGKPGVWSCCWVVIRLLILVLILLVLIIFLILRCCCIRKR